jgi:hypothetical protein
MTPNTINTSTSKYFKQSGIWESTHILMVMKTDLLVVYSNGTHNARSMSLTYPSMSALATLKEATDHITS